MPHVFVETNWLVAYASPAHHQLPAAAELLLRASQGEFIPHLPNACIVEARHLIRAKCQPRHEANAIRRYVSWAQAAGQVTAVEAANTRTALDKYESSIQRELDGLDQKIHSMACEPYVNVFALDDAMLERATSLALEGLALKPIDHAILAGVLVSASRLWESGERQISFCEMDADLQPWDKTGNPKIDLRDAYDEAHVWVYANFTMTEPERRPDFP